MKASTEWLNKTSANFRANHGRAGCAHLSHYTVNYCEWGDGPPLVLVPGLAGGYGLLGPLASLLAAHYRVISYQLRGEDDCFALRQKFGMSDLVDDLAEFLDWHGLEAPAVLGVSFGGALALQFAATYPSRLGALVLQGTGVRLERGLLQSVAGTILSRYPLPPDNQFVNQFFNLFFGGKQPRGPLFDFVTRQCWQTDQSVMAHRFQLVEGYDMTEQLGRVRVPTLVFAGDRDVLVSERSLTTLCQGLSDVQLVRLARCGHLGFITQARQVTSEVHRFLSQSSQLCRPTPD